METHGIAPNVMSKWCQLLDINIDINQLVADLLSALLTDVGVDILRGGKLGVAKQFLCVLGIDIVVKQHGGVGVAQLMGRASNAGLFGIGLPPLPERLFVNDSILRIRED